MSASDGSNRRRHPRCAVSLPVRELQPEQHLMRVTSLSVGGLFIPDASPRALGSRLLLELDLLGSGQPLVAPARVVHAGGGPRGFGLGLEFQSPQASLEAYLSRLPKDTELVTTEWYLPTDGLVEN